MQSEQINELATALAKAQAEMKVPAFNRINPHFKSKYADLPAVIDAARDALSKNGLSVTQEPRVTDASFILATVLRHSSGQWVESTYPLPQGKPQEIGSAITYARRYSLSAICGIAADDDDDGNAGSIIKKPPADVRQAPAVAPHRIDVPTTLDGKAADWGAWGKLFVDAINAAPDAGAFQAWCDLNAVPIEHMRAADTKISVALQDRIAKGKAKWLGGV